MSKQVLLVDDKPEIIRLLCFIWQRTKLSMLKILLKAIAWLKRKYARLDYI